MVDDSGGADFTSIQAAVDAASERAMVEIRAMAYPRIVDPVNTQFVRRSPDPSLFEVINLSISSRNS